MPIIESPYRAPISLRNPHLNTIVPNLFRKISNVQYSRERMELDDGDFIDLDFSLSTHGEKLILVLHGLEGNSERAYVKGLVRGFTTQGWDSCVFNQRGCSGELNRILSSYHSGKTDDLKLVLNFITSNYNYREIHLLGISLGGNIALKYLGEAPETAASTIKSAVAISTPIHLESSAYELAKMKNYIYMRRFLKTLKAKSIAKIHRHKESDISIDEINKCKNFIDFDNVFTAPVHGFQNAVDYWTKSSSKQYLSSIQVPTLLINALDDPFLSPQCFPEHEAKQNQMLYLSTPKRGGHVGFVQSFPLSSTQYIDQASVDFIGSH